jgi:hypothetical protein
LEEKTRDRKNFFLWKSTINFCLDEETQEPIIYIKTPLTSILSPLGERARVRGKPGIFSTIRQVLKYVLGLRSGALSPDGSARFSSPAR